MVSSAEKNAQAAPKYDNPVCVVVGGTSGIGRGMVQAFNRHTKGRGTIVIVGRNEAASKETFEHLRKETPETSGKYDFVQCDISVMENAHKAATTLLQKYPKINFLCISAGFITTSARNETVDGIDKQLAVHYYGRWVFVNDLLPALYKAQGQGEDAKVMTIMGPGKGGAIDDDYGLKKNFTVTRAALAPPTYNDLMCEEFSTRHPKIVFIHAYPGFVKTNILNTAEEQYLRMMVYLLPLFFWWTVTIDQCGEFLWSGYYRCTPGPEAKNRCTTGTNAYRIGSKGEDIGMKNYHGTKEQRAQLWEHTIKETRSAVAVPQ
ncbi:hypothetical protein Moror_3835 [Moniliophthora roreri MCA 2997]|uniref:NAD(P)-binding protein n=2 Tax=Moniliophthora roreri TaxID=221103 RepID=V2XNR6_MONRO|nr:hypothetical protein Moror_3835 [Moniliophthora roreri MCA 2997]